MKYLDFLKALLALGPKLPAVIALVQHIVSDVQEILDLINPGTFAAERGAVIDVSAAEEALEEQVVAVMNEDENARGIGDGTFLRTIWTFIQAHPELLTFLFSLFAKK